MEETEEFLGCGSNSCYLEKPKDIGTNGTCDCLKDLKIDESRRVRQYIQKLKNEINEMKNEQNRDNFFRLLGEFDLNIEVPNFNNLKKEKIMNSKFSKWTVSEQQLEKLYNEIILGKSFRKIN